MQSALLFTYILLSSAMAARVKVKSHQQFSSSSQGACRVLAKWICQPKTYKENLVQVKECCGASDVGNEDLRKACCQYAGMKDEGITNRTVKTRVEKPIEKPPEVVEDIEDEEVEVNDEVDEVASPVSPIVDVDEDNSGLSPKLDDDLFEVLAAGIWRPVEVEPDLGKSLVKAFHAKKKPGLSWSMSCVDECEEDCDGGECQPVQTSEDCEVAAGQLSKSFFAYDPKKAYLAKEMKRFPRGCFVKNGKSNTNMVRWNPPTSDAPTVKLNNVCGCYK